MTCLTAAPSPDKPQEFTFQTGEGVKTIDILQLFSQDLKYCTIQQLELSDSGGILSIIGKQLQVNTGTTSDVRKWDDLTMKLDVRALREE